MASKWNFWRREYLITCPQNHQPAGVMRGAGHRIAACSRWPERAGCGQQCLAEIAAAPHDCEVRRIFERWYAGRHCAVCGTAFGEIHWEYQKPAVLRAGGRSEEWSEIPVERLRGTLAASAPICFACHLAGALVREHPELVVDRSRKSIS